MSDLQITSRYFVSGEGVRDKQWYRLPNDSPGTSYSISTFDELPVRRTFYSHISPRVQIYPASAEVHFSPPSGSISNPNISESVAQSTPLPDVNGHPVSSVPVNPPEPDSNLENVPSTASTADPHSEKGVPPIASQNTIPIMVAPVTHGSLSEPKSQPQRLQNAGVQSKQEPMPTKEQNQSLPFLFGPHLRNRKLSGVARLIAPPIATLASPNPEATPLDPSKPTDISSTKPAEGLASAPVSPVRVSGSDKISGNSNSNDVVLSQDITTRDRSNAAPLTETPRNDSHKPSDIKQVEVDKNLANQSAENSSNYQDTKASSTSPVNENLEQKREAPNLEPKPASSSVQRSSSDKKPSISGKLALESQREALENIVARHKVDKRRIKNLPPLPEPKKGVRSASKSTDNRNQADVPRESSADKGIESRSTSQASNKGDILSSQPGDIGRSPALDEGVGPISSDKNKTKPDLLTSVSTIHKTVGPVLSDALSCKDPTAPPGEKVPSRKSSKSVDVKTSQAPAESVILRVSTSDELSSEKNPSEKTPTLPTPPVSVSNSGAQDPSANNDSPATKIVPSSSASKSVTTPDIAIADEGLLSDPTAIHSSPTGESVSQVLKAVPEVKEKSSHPFEPKKPLVQIADTTRKDGRILDKSAEKSSKQAQKNRTDHSGTDSCDVITSAGSSQVEATKGEASPQSTMSPKRGTQLNVATRQDSQRFDLGSSESEYLIAVFKHLVKTIVRYNQKKALYRDGRFKENRRNFLYQLLSNLVTSGKDTSNLSPLIETPSTELVAHPESTSREHEKQISRNHRCDHLPDESHRTEDARHISPSGTAIQKAKSTSGLMSKAVSGTKRDSKSSSEIGKQVSNDLETTSPLKVMKNMRFKMEEWKRKIVNDQAPYDDICLILGRLSTVLSKSGQFPPWEREVSDRELQTWLTDLESGHATLACLWSSVSDGVLSLKGISSNKEAVAERTVAHMHAVVNIVKWCQAILTAIIGRCGLAIEQGAKGIEALSFHKPISDFLDAGGKQGDRPDMYLLGKLRLISRRLSQIRLGNVRSSVSNAVDQLIKGVGELLDVVSSLSDVAVKLDDLRSSNPDGGRSSKYDRSRDRPVKSTGRRSQGFESTNARHDNKVYSENSDFPIQAGLNRRPKRADTLDGNSNKTSKIIGQKRKSDSSLNGSFSREENGSKRRMTELEGKESASDVRNRNQVNSIRRGKEVPESDPVIKTKGKGILTNRASELRDKDIAKGANLETAAIGSDSRKFDKRRFVLPTGPSSVKAKNDLPPVPRLNETSKSNLAPPNNDKYTKPASRTGVGNPRDFNNRVGKTSYGSEPSRVAGSEGRDGRNDRRSTADTLHRLMSLQSSVSKKHEDSERLRPNANRNVAAVQQAPQSILKKRPDERERKSNNASSDAPCAGSDGQSRSIVKNNSNGPRIAEIGLDLTRPKKVSFSKNLIQSEDISKCSREEVEVLFNDGFDILGDRNELQKQLVNDRIACLSRGAIITCHGYLARYIESMKRDAEGISPIGSDRMRLQYANSSARQWSRTFNMPLPAGRQNVYSGNTRVPAGGLGLRSARPPTIQHFPPSSNNSPPTKTANF